MNYCLDFSLRVEDELIRLLAERAEERGCSSDDLAVEDEDELYECAMNTMLEKDEGRTWAAGNIRVGEIILIVDSDTRVPEDSLICGKIEKTLITVAINTDFLPQVPLRCARVLNWLSFSTPAASCRLSTTPSKTASPTLPILYTPRSSTPSGTETAPLSSDTTLSSGGKPFRVSPSKRMA